MSKELFAEEYDFMYDSIADSNDKILKMDDFLKK